MQTVALEELNGPLTVQDVNQPEPTGRIVVSEETVLDTHGGDQR
jgi:hypothetical protein